MVKKRWKFGSQVFILNFAFCRPVTKLIENIIVVAWLLTESSADNKVQVEC